MNEEELPLIETDADTTPKRSRKVTFMENQPEGGAGRLDDAVLLRRTFDSNENWTVDKKPVTRGAVNDFTREIRPIPDTRSPRETVLAPGQALGWILRDWDSIKVSPFIPIYLVILGLLTALVGVAIDITIVQLVDTHKEFMNLGNNELTKTILWVLFLIGFVLFGMFATQTIRPNAVGSGIPEMKSMLSGVPLYRYLSVLTMIAKIIGLTSGIGGGLIVGKEGPLVHMSSIIANQLAKLPILRKLRYNPTLMQQMLAAACAAGVAGNAGCPIGGVLFSIEVTACYYNVSNYWTAFLTAIISGSTYRYFWSVYSKKQGNFQPFVPTHYNVDEISVGTLEIVIFLGIGFICGILAVVFIKLLSFLNRNRPKLTKGFSPSTARLINLYGYAFFVCIILGVISCPATFGEFMALPTKDTLSDLFNSESLDSLGHDWGQRSIYLDLCIFTVSYYFLCLFCLSISIPCGLLLPVLATGGGIGRLIGEYLLELYPDGIPEGGTIYPGGYALAGAAALGGGVTQSISSSVIVFEITGQLVYLLPVLLSVMVSTGISRLLSVSVYDQSLIDRGLPFMPALKEWTSDITAKDIMITDIHPISAASTVSELSQVLINNPTDVIPVVTPQNVLRGCIRRSDLEDALVEYLEHSEDSVIQQQVPQTLFHSLSKAKIEQILNSNLISKQHLPISQTPSQQQIETLREQQQQQQQQQQQHTEHIEYLNLRNTRPQTLSDQSITTPISSYTRVRRETEDIQKSVVKIKTGHVLALHSTPIQLTESSSLATMHQIFIMNRLSCAYVTNSGILVGMVKRSDVSKYDGTINVFHLPKRKNRHNDE